MVDTTVPYGIGETPRNVFLADYFGERGGAPFPGEYVISLVSHGDTVGELTEAFVYTVNDSVSVTRYTEYETLCRPGPAPGRPGLLRRPGSLPTAATSRS